MPWGKHSEDDNQKDLSPKTKKLFNEQRRQVNQESKRRLQQERPASSTDGKGKR